MITVRRVRRQAVIASAAVVLAAGLYASSAFAETAAPWWGLTTGARPTNLGGSSGKNEVQKLRVKATRGDYLLVVGEEVYLLPFNTSAAVIREHLESGRPAGYAPPIVIEEPSGEEHPHLFPHTHLFKIVYPSQAVPPPTVSAERALVEAFGGQPLEEEGRPGEVEATELEKGAASENELVVYAENLGNAPTSGKVTITEHLPPGLIATSIRAHAGGTSHLEQGPVSCDVTALTCHFEKNLEGKPGILPPFEAIEMRVGVQVPGGATSGERNVVTVTGGGAVAASAERPLAIGSAERFGIDEYTVVPEAKGGVTEAQAGSHPYQLTTAFTLNSQTADHEGNPRSVGLVKDLVAELPPGLVGNATAFAQCTDAQFAEQVNGENGEVLNGCPAAAAVGAASVTFNSPSIHLATLPVPVFNMVPRRGEPVRLGFKGAGIVSAFLDTAVRTGGDYGVTVSSVDVPQGQWLLGARVTIWGVPGAPAHDGQRGWNCILRIGGPGSCPAIGASEPPPFLSMPTSCQQPFESQLRADSWGTSSIPTQIAEPSTYRLPEAVSGCNHLPFSPSIRVAPDSSAASTPTGVNVDVHVPQESTLRPGSLAEAAVQDVAVTLPEGMTLNPSAANGLEACSEALAGFTGFAMMHGLSTATFTPTLPEPLQEGINFCPDAAKVGTVKIKVPILANPLEGSLYLATQNENPFGGLLAVYLVAKDPVSGVLVKVPGEVQLSATGRITGTFHNSPEAPFEDAELHFFGGERAPLATPARCGTYTTTATFTPWSGTGPVESKSSFNIVSGPGGGPCPGAQLPFTPTLEAGTTNTQAGAFSPLTTTVGRHDGNQALGVVQVRPPPGLSAVLAGVKLCPEAQANAGTCGPESQIGETTVSAGFGSAPVTVPGGRVYLTEKYRGAPFGLSIVSPVKAGPFDLARAPGNHPACDCVVVRAKVEVDPLTAQVQVVTDSEGPYAIPRMIEGVPLQVKHVNVTINRPGFTFNPTNCEPLDATGLITGDEDTLQPVSTPFQVANCTTLGFAPDLKASTAGKTSRLNGASLSVKLIYPRARFGSQANIKSVKVELPKALPSRLTTLHHACVAATFDANRAHCPPESIVGHAKAITPVLPVPLEGPAYFVSHGNEAFPSLTVVLSGYGVTVQLVGTTFIRNGVTSSTFKTTPDAPIDSFELTLPQGPFSALGSITDLCQGTKTVTSTQRVAVRRGSHVVHILRKLRRTVTPSLPMPTDFVAQNGAELHQSTKIEVAGCSLVVPHRKGAKAGRHTRRRRA